MAKYTVKLVDHAAWSPHDQFGIQKAVQKRFDEAFDGTPDSVDVSWVVATPNDNLVVHFVPDRDHSYLKVRWPQANINPRAGGHTYTGDRPLSGTEVYQTRQGDRFPYASYAATVFHEALHNLYPFQTVDFIHKLDGGGEAAGLAAPEYSFRTKMTEHNKELIRRGFSIKNPQYL
jgi:hypothetical protein